MNKVYNSIMTGLTEVIEDANGKKEKLSRREVMDTPVKQYGANEVQEMRKASYFTINDIV